MLTAITREVSSSLPNCELSFIPRRPIDLAKARAQHHAYEELLRNLGARLISLPEEPDLPDSMFVEDPVIVLDEIAVVCSLGSATRRREAPSLAAALEKYRKLAFVQLPGLLEGGDVLRVGKRIFAGLTRRTNAEGIRQLAVIVSSFGYDLTVVPVSGCLHLKSAVTYLGRNTLLGNRAWVKCSRFAGFDWVDVDPTEPHAGNALAIGDTVVFPASFPLTTGRIEAHGFHVTPIEIGELQKAESGLTCSSLLLDAPE
ncbi:MAG TPA: arginine deiminase-related protein [Verrucomicrobiae bacterium]|nr:arginine deiminase-related protein [Verrucomicrobiae bacterium]